MIIWLFREPRSGGTAFASKLANLLGRTNLMVNVNTSVEDITNIRNPEHYLFSTHEFQHITRLRDWYDQPILLIRCTRKDKIEQCLSQLLVLWVNQGKSLDNAQFNMHVGSDKQSVFDTAPPTVFSKKDVINYFRRNNTMNYFWDMYSSEHKNCTVYYEDLCSTGVQIPALNIDNLNIIDGHTHTQKLPNDYKQRLCFNYDMVKRWATECLQSPGGGMVDTQR